MTPRERKEALNQHRQAAKLFASLNGELNASDEHKFLKSARWAAIQSAIFDALKPIPGALAALVQGLKSAGVE